MVPAHILSALNWWLDPKNIQKGVPFSTPLPAKMLVTYVSGPVGAHTCSSSRYTEHVHVPQKDMDMFLKDMMLYVNVLKL